MSSAFRGPAIALVGVFMFAGCGGSRYQVGGSGITPTANVVRGALPDKKRSPQYVYVSNTLHGGPNFQGSVDIYSALLNGNISPIVVISGSLTQLTEVNGIVVDRAGEIYVVNTDTGEIVGFAAGSSGNVSPNVVISGSYTELSRPTGLAIDSNDNLYVANCASGCGIGSQPAALLEFAAGSNGNVAPIRSISGSYTQLSNANATALDASGNVYVSNWISNTIVEFDSTANGNASPIRELAGSNTLLNGPDGIAVGADALWAGSANENYLERFKPDANGNVPPVAAISGHKTYLASVDGVALDSRGNVYSCNPGNRSIREFAAKAHGDVRATNKIAGSKTQLVEPEFIFVK